MFEVAAYVVGLVLLVAVAHGLARVLTKGGLQRIWDHWNLVGAVLLIAGIGGIAVGWLLLGLQTNAGSALAGLGLLGASAGVWMLCWT